MQQGHDHPDSIPYAVATNVVPHALCFSSRITPLLSTTVYSSGTIYFPRFSTAFRKDSTSPNRAYAQHIRILKRSPRMIFLIIVDSLYMREANASGFLKPSFVIIQRYLSSRSGSSSAFAPNACLTV